MKPSTFLAGKIKNKLKARQITKTAEHQRFLKDLESIQREKTDYL